MARLTIPTTAPLPASLRVDASNPIVSRILSRLSRVSLILLALEWLGDDGDPLTAPYLGDEDEDEEADVLDMNPPAKSHEEAREIYNDLQARKGSKREVLDRITDGDWRHGLSLYQLAMADLQYLYDHPTWLKWTAYRVAPLRIATDDDLDQGPEVDKEALKVPRFHPSTFLQKLQAQVLPDVKAHYNFDRHRHLPMVLLRIFVIESPYNSDVATAGPGGNGLSNAESSRTLCIAFPDASPHIFIARPQSVGPQAAGESKSLSRLIVEGIPKALSRPRERYALKATGLTARNLPELLDRRGAGRTNAAGGGWGIYADEKAKKLQSPLCTVLPTPPLSEGDVNSGTYSKTTTAAALKTTARKRAFLPAAEQDLCDAKRARLVARTRFGDSAKCNDGKGVDRLDIVLEDAFPERVPSLGTYEFEQDEESETRPRSTRPGSRRSRAEATAQAEGAGGGENVPDEGQEASGAWRPDVRLTFHGPHVFAGIRQLVENGIMNGERLPGWLTGENGVTVGAVRHGRIRGHKGSGL